MAPLRLLPLQLYRPCAHPIVMQSSEALRCCHMRRAHRHWSPRPLNHAACCAEYQQPLPRLIALLLIACLFHRIFVLLGYSFGEFRRFRLTACRVSAACSTYTFLILHPFLHSIISHS
ncbi:hypothetical protein R3P38DRAFT_2937153 [Favolaschia claudopus]|uniref:Succinate dehydrogenase subunit 3 n=1 Tax=Favolaschia claudopus TaxID=2862362 RepID=A0AAW0BQY3_9AGAR